jgi:cell division protein FtsW (lipid II flippase)
MACAWATFACYGSMMVVSFIWGQKEYRIPYAWKKLVAYIVIVILLFFIHNGLVALWTNRWFNLSTATLLLMAYLWFVGKIERKELRQMPVIGRLFNR